jgi:hypothetical protein
MIFEKPVTEFRFVWSSDKRIVLIREGRRFYLPPNVFIVAHCVILITGLFLSIGYFRDYAVLWVLLMVFSSFLAKSRMITHKDKAATYNINFGYLRAALGAFLSLAAILFIMLLSAFIFKMEFRKVALLTACISLPVTVIAYSWCSGDTIFDFSAREAYRNCFLFRKPLARFSDFGGIDKIFNSYDMSEYYYRLWYRHERFGRGVSISGHMSSYNMNIKERFREQVLSKFAPLPLSEPDEKAELHDGDEEKYDRLMSVYGTDTFFIYFRYRSIQKGRKYLDSVSLTFKKNDEIVTLAEHKRGIDNPNGLELCRKAEQLNYNLLREFGNAVRIVLIKEGRDW